MTRKTKHKILTALRVNSLLRYINPEVSENVHSPVSSHSPTLPLKQDSEACGGGR